MRVMKTRPPERNWSMIIGPVLVSINEPVYTVEPDYHFHFSDGKKVFGFRVTYVEPRPNRIGKAEFYRGNLGQLVMRTSKGVKAEALGLDGNPL